MSTFTLLMIQGGDSLTPSSYNLNNQMIQAAIRALQDITSGTGTVSSVGLVAPNIFSVTNSPVTSSGDLTLSLNSQPQNMVFASPNESSGTPLFMALTASHLPNVPPSKGGTGLSSLGTAYQMIRVNSAGNSYEYFTLDSANAKIVLTPSAGKLTVSVVESELDISNMNGVLPIEKGGSGASTAQNAIKNLTQASSGTVGYVYTLDGSKNPTWAAIPEVATPEIENGAVTYEKIQLVSGLSLLGNDSVSEAEVKEIPLGGGLLFQDGFLATNNSQVLVVDSNTTVPETGGSIFVDAAGAVTISLPDVSTISVGFTCMIKKVGGEAGAVTVTVNNITADTIDGDATKTISSQYHSLTLQYAGVISGANKWFIISKTT